MLDSETFNAEGADVEERTTLNWRSSGIVRC